MKQRGNLVLNLTHALATARRVSCDFHGVSDSEDESLLELTQVMAQVEKSWAAVKNFNPRLQEEINRVEALKDKLLSIPEVYRNEQVGWLLRQIEWALGDPENAVFLDRLKSIQEPGMAPTPVSIPISVETPPVRPGSKSIPIRRVASLGSLSDLISKKDL